MGYLNSYYGALLSGLIEPFGINKKCSQGFNVGLISSLCTSLSNGFALIFKFSLIFMNMQMRSFSYRTIRWKDLSNCASDAINTCIDGGLMMFWGWSQFVYCVVLWFSLILKVFINIREYANEIIYISGHGMKGICQTFNLVQSLVVYDM